MAPPPQVLQWASQNYPRPAIDPGWLEGCHDYITGSLSIDANIPEDLRRMFENIEIQLLGSDLRDSMAPATGLPPSILTASMATLSGPPLLVEIIAITEIGHSAFQLQNTRQGRIDRADLAGLNAVRGEGGEREEEEEGPVPRYPRSMLQFELSDGTSCFKAIEYKRIPDLVLGETPLGYKLLLKNVPFRSGIAMLEPGNVILKGHQTEDRQANQDADFVRGLRQRMGLPDEAPVLVPPLPSAIPVQAPAPARPPVRTVRETSPSEMDDFFDNMDDYVIPVPARNPPAPQPRPLSSNVTHCQQVATIATSTAGDSNLPPLFLPSPSPERPKVAPDSDFEFGDVSLMADDLAELDRVEQALTQATTAPSRATLASPNLYDSDDDMPLDRYGKKPKGSATRRQQTYEDDIIDVSD